MRILLYDVENQPNLSYTWPGSLYEQNVIEVKKNWQLLSIAYKFLGDNEVKCISKQGEKTDRNLVKKFHKILNQADIVVAHNAVNFDNKKVLAKFIEYGLTPPKPFKTVDTLQVARLRFSFNSNRLNDLGKLLGLGEKIKIEEGFQLWLDCMADKPAAWKKMISYNKQDVLLLEKVYLKLRPWMDKHPHSAADQDGEACPKCTSKNLTRSGVRKTIPGIYRRYQCQDCGGWSQGRLRLQKSKVGLKNIG